MASRPSRGPGTYYYSSGGRMTLVPDARRVAVRAAVAARLGEGVEAQPVNDDLVLLDASLLPPTDAARLRESGDALDVYDAGGARVVVLPEIRIEVDRPADGARIRKWLAQEGGNPAVESRGDGVYDVRLNGGGSRDALELANRVWETFHPAVSHPRFIRIVPKPRTAR